MARRCVGPKRDKGRCGIDRDDIELDHYAGCWRLRYATNQNAITKTTPARKINRGNQSPCRWGGKNTRPARQKNHGLWGKGGPPPVLQEAPEAGAPAEKGRTKRPPSLAPLQGPPPPPKTHPAI